LVEFWALNPRAHATKSNPIGRPGAGSLDHIVPLLEPHVHWRMIPLAAQKLILRGLCQRQRLDAFLAERPATLGGGAAHTGTLETIVATIGIAGLHLRTLPKGKRSEREQKSQPAHCNPLRRTHR
jgi:hypothetical protein